jgi:hypothetical protein
LAPHQERSQRPQEPLEEQVDAHHKGENSCTEKPIIFGWVEASFLLGRGKSKLQSNYQVTATLCRRGCRNSERIQLRTLSAL